jgi:adenylate kinase family enzyme
MECVLDQVIKSLVVLDDYPDTLAQLACLHKIPQDKMVRLTCRKNRAEHLAYKKDAAGNAVLWRDLAYKRDSDGNAVLWRDFAKENDDEWHRDMDELYAIYLAQVQAYNELEHRNGALHGHNTSLQAEVHRLQLESYSATYAANGLGETMSHLESEIKRSRDNEDATQTFVAKAKAYITKARTEAGRAEFAATSALISEALRVLDRA